MSDDTGNRWCEGHQQYHGPLYVCNLYDEATKREITTQGDELMANLDSPTWVEEQLANGVPAEAIAIMRVFAGLA